MLDPPVAWEDLASFPLGSVFPPWLGTMMPSAREVHLNLHLNPRLPAYESGRRPFHSSAKGLGDSRRSPSSVGEAHEEPPRSEDLLMVYRRGIPQAAAREAFPLFPAWTGNQRLSHDAMRPDEQIHAEMTTQIRNRLAVRLAVQTRRTASASAKAICLPRTRAAPLKPSWRTGAMLGVRSDGTKELVAIGNGSRTETTLGHCACMVSS